MERPDHYRRIHTPTLIQMEATECGATALGIVLAYYGKYVPIEKLRIACGVSRDGSNAYNMTMAAKEFGMKAEGYSMDLKSLYTSELPLILHWKFDHFVVLEGFGEKQVYINDPASGPRSISYEELDQSFTGVVLAVTPSSSFQRSGKPFSLSETLYQRAKSVKMPILYAVLVGICLIIPGLAMPAFTRVFIDNVLASHELSQGAAYLLLVGIVCMSLFMGALTYLQGDILNRLHTRLSLRLGSEAFWHMLRLPLDFYMQRYPGEIAYRLNLNESISRTIAGQLSTTIISLLFVFIYGIAILYYDWVIGAVAMIMILLNLFLMRLVYSARTNAYARYQADVGRNTSYALGGLQNIETIKATGTENLFFSTWAGYYVKVANILQEIGKKDAFLAVVSPLLSALTILTLIGVGGWRILHGQITVGMFLAIQMLLTSFMTPILQLVGFNQSLQFLRTDAARLDDLRSYKEDPIYKKSHKESSSKLNGHISLQNVTFGYNQLNEAILRDISFELHPGKSVGLVGPTGCGKSTLAKLIAGLFKPWSGEILYDGIPFTQVSHTQLTHSLSLVEQDSFLFTGTVRDNLTLFDPTVDQNRLLQATQDAVIHEDILARIGGYDFELEENGANLSGGQKQRFEIARGLVKNPTILIMDEATSAIDTEIESLILQHFRRRGCALLIIAHRLSTVQHCDEILVLNQGKIVERGTHASLMQHEGLYKELSLIKK